MKRIITLRLCIVIIISMLFTALLSFYFQIKSSQEIMYKNSFIRMNQISQILEKNEQDIEVLKQNQKNDYFILAKAAAYIVQNQPEVIGNLAEMKKIASLLQIDEFHLFDPKGTLYAGSEPKYFDYTFYSGEQMQFFLPMLSDYSLELCQDVLPNTAENKPMQYTAVWQEDHKGIVQIGMKPTRLLNALKQNELSHIFNLISVEKGVTIFAIDPTSGHILGSTNRGLLDKKTDELGFSLSETSSGTLNITIDSMKNYCVIKPIGNVLVGISSTYETLYQNVKPNMLLIIVSLFLLSIMIIILILKMLDYSILQGIYQLINGMKKITDGDLDFSITVNNSPEFITLSDHINEMVHSLLETTTKLSLIFENVNIPIAVYEYNKDMKRVLATSKLGDILMLSPEDLSVIMSDQTFFKRKIKELSACPLAHEEDVYLLGNDNSRYIRMKSYDENNKILGVLVDVTDEMVEKQQLISERDIDFLTKLSSRRALFAKLDTLFLHSYLLKHATILMVDLDNLKYVNDTWGHECGDLLLKKVAALLNTCDAPNRLIARLSGDEFVLLIYGSNSNEELQGYLDKLSEEMLKSTLDVSAKEQVPVRLSGGYIFFSDTLKSYNQLLYLADQTMYQVKKGKKGCFKRCELT